ncbi:DUF1501 domain-containing protein [bacterium]|nr:DUF1501 domain-containing protein [bacterium]
MFSQQKKSPLTPTRRELMRLATAGVTGVSASGWLGALAARAAEDKSPNTRRKSCVLLWMDGGPSHVETFDPKSEATADVRGELGAIETSVPGIQLGEKFPQLSRWMQYAALLRGMSTPEADHDRARIYMHTGYRPGFGGVTYPTLGSTVAAELGESDATLPNFIVTGTPLTKHDVLRDAGYRGPRYQPLVLADASQGLDNATPRVETAEFDRRTGLLDHLEQRFAKATLAPAADAHLAGLAAAVRLMRSDRRTAFNLDGESDRVRDAYGNSDFGRGCLLARRLVEVGVPFVEVYLANWDSHEKNVADNTRTLMTQVDQGLSALLSDLHDRSLLDDTLIVWMGEFGRTPRINRNGGRDHYAKAWTTLLAGGGVKGGQTVGATDRQGQEVTDRPISVQDFMATVCRLLEIDYGKEVIAPNGRPIRIVDKDEQVIRELL